MNYGLLKQKQEEAILGLLKQSPMQNTLDAIRLGLLNYGDARATPWTESVSQKLALEEPLTGMRSGDFIPGPQQRIAHQDWQELQNISQQPGYGELPWQDRAMLRGAQGLTAFGAVPLLGGMTKVPGRAAANAAKHAAIEKLQRIPVSVRGLLANDEVGDLATKRVQRQAFGESFGPEGQEYAKWVKNRSKKGESIIHSNQKTGFSIDFSTSCPKRNCKSGACAYCYVEQPRSEAKFGTGPGMYKKREDIDNPYRGEIQGMPAEVVNELNRDGGIRMFSFGDYRPDKDFENVAGVLQDAQAKGLYVKAITKERELIDRFGDHPNFRANISVDAMPRELSNAPTVEEALEWKAGRPNVKIRAVALNEEQARMFAADPRIDTVTLYHGSTGDKLINTVMAQNPELAARGEDALKAELSSWQNMPPRSKAAQQLHKEFPGRFCCTGSKCSRDNNKCGFGLGALLTGVMLPEWMPGADHTEEEPTL